ncbi:DNA polymerase IV [Cohnella sp. CIP 111063]|uniref:DNA polymerase IV n=1 Tax=unclassified Cohnella TaxID=2636738 RepID=UPI000B8BFA7C|nr:MULTISPECIES: DNA polymerase IV [unclassified Cohnella]OXS54994.1 DNA polymerase IV [Cohnella sp. CIP 111063]
MPPERTIFLVDCQSFYASVEKSAHPEYRNLPVAVGDPVRRSGIILAACPLAKSFGVKTADRNFSALAKCPQLTIIRPRMMGYITISLEITRILETYTDLVEVFSIDESFMDVTGILKRYDSVEDLAQQIRSEILLSTGVWTRIGIGPTKILAKMVNNYAKKTDSGLFRLGFDNLEQELWPRQVQELFMVADKMSAHFQAMGMYRIEDIAKLSLDEFKKRMRLRMGRKADVQARYYWEMTWGIDDSPVVSSIRDEIKSISHGKTLRASLYYRRLDIELVLHELAAGVCRRARQKGKQGQTVSVELGETDGSWAARFGRQTTLPHATNLTRELAKAALRLFRTHWQGMPVCYLYVSLTQLREADATQLTLFEDRAKMQDLEHVTDVIKDRFGTAAIIPASSLQEASIVRERAGQIGGHYK